MKTLMRMGHREFSCLFAGGFERTATGVGWATADADGPVLDYDVKVGNPVAPQPCPVDTGRRYLALSRLRRSTYVRSRASHRGFRSSATPQSLLPTRAPPSFVAHSSPPMVGARAARRAVILGKISAISVVAFGWG
jgi:hypothetical protein